ncbi:THAP domain-containing protein 1-like isoform X1 [Pararge aegeria]|uniref:Jg9200 protein n=3 Tax=Pararge aegeria TaxID=116150 RepID=A0A8S4SHL6_9NEOP|nr:THAP domain-containing protein 1-like isoform X1 [Pararge aegeria]CAH2262826.1 jg9200 [Pararge aegeria aegeria]
MRKCVYCKFIYKKGSQTSFHRFPTDVNVKRIWLDNMKANWSPKEYDALCSNHFDETCFIDHQNRRTLKVGSVPTIFKENFEVSESCSDDVARIKKEDVEDQKPTISHIYVCKFAMETPALTENMVSSTSKSSYQSSERNGAKQISVINFEDSNMAVSNHHDYKTSQILKSRIQYGLSHDHKYVNSSVPQKKALKHAMKKLKASNLEKKILKQRVKRLEIKVANLKSRLRRPPHSILGI